MKIVFGFSLARGKWMAGIAGWLLLLACRSPQDRGKMVFRYNEQTGIATLDPAFAKNQSIIWPVHQLYNTLVETDPGLRIVPSLAKSWDVSSDRRTYTFHLRTDVYFCDHDAFPGGRGRKMTAADVVFSFARLLDPGTASSGAWIFHDRADGPNSFAAPDDSTFTLRLTAPFQPILGLLSMPYCSVVAREAVVKYGRDFRRHPCGTGPFRLGSWEEGQALVLLRNDRYFERDSAGGPLPYLDAIKISFFDNRATEFLLLQQGQLDFINDIDPSFKDEVLTRAGDLKPAWKGRLVLAKHAYLNTEYIGIVVDSANPLVAHSPLRMRAVRQAINYAFDRRKMMLYLRNSIGTPAESGFFPRALPSFDSAAVPGYHYDPKRAAVLLAEAGFPGGRGLPVFTLKTVDTYADFAGFIARQLEESGIPVKVDVLQKSLLLEEVANNQAPMFRASWIGDYPDAENYASVFYSPNPSPPNYTRYANPAYDALYRLAVAENNDSVRYELYRRMDRMIVADAPVIPLWYDEVIRLVSPRVSGFAPNGLNLLELRRTKIR